jgi:hypothetical protein
LPAINQQVYRSTTRLGITQDSPNRLKKAFKMA